MSKRFGRNQKRKLIADRDGLANLLKHEAERVSALQYNMKRNAETVCVVEQILGDNFFGLPPRDFQVDELGRGMRIPKISKAMEFDYSEPSQISLMEKLYLLEEAEYSEWYDRLRNARHFRFVTPAGDVAYAATDCAWKGMPDDVFNQRMREEIARSMAAHLTQNRRKV